MLLFLSSSHSSREEAQGKQKKKSCQKARKRYVFLNFLGSTTVFRQETEVTPFPDGLEGFEASLREFQAFFPALEEVYVILERSLALLQ